MLTHLYGGLRASIFTDNIQMIVISILLLISSFLSNSFTGDKFSFSFIKKKSTIIKCKRVKNSYIPSYTAGLTFFIAVAATTFFTKEIGKEFMLQKIMKL